VIHRVRHGATGWSRARRPIGTTAIDPTDEGWAPAGALVFAARVPTLVRPARDRR